MSFSIVAEAWAKRHACLFSVLRLSMGVSRASPVMNLAVATCEGRLAKVWLNNAKYVVYTRNREPWNRMLG